MTDEHWESDPPCGPDPTPIAPGRWPVPELSPEWAVKQAVASAALEGREIGPEWQQVLHKVATGELSADNAAQVEASRVRVVAWASLYAQTRDEPGDRLSCSYEHTPLLLSDLRVLVESALPWPERCCTQCGNGDLYPRRCSQCGQHWADRACGPTHALIAEELGIGDVRRMRTYLAEQLGLQCEMPPDKELLFLAAYWIKEGLRAALERRDEPGRPLAKEELIAEFDEMEQRRSGGGDD